MKGIVKFDAGLLVRYRFHLKKETSKTGRIYARFHFFQKGIHLTDRIISTDITCDPKRWIGNRIEGKATEEDIQESNSKLDEIALTVREGLFEIKRMENISFPILLQEVTIGLKTKITNKVPKGQKQLFLSRLQKQSLTSISKSYLDGRNCSISYSKKFEDVVRLAKECFGDDRPIDSFKKSDVERFKAWMKQKAFKHNTIMTYLNKLRTLFIHAIENGIMAQSPIPKKNGLISNYKGSKRIVLTEEELIKISSIPDNKLSITLEKTKYIFLLLASTGLGYGELKSVKKRHFEEINGQLYLQKNRNKSDEPFEVLFSPLATRIYHQYFNWMATMSGTELPVEPFEDLPSIEYFTRSLKKLMKVAGIKKNVTSYTARHTFATDWIRNSGCVVTLMKIMGHTNLKTTQIYLNPLTEDRVRKANEVYSRSSFHQN